MAQGAMLIENGIVVTMDAARTILDGGSVALEGDRIAAIGRPDDLRARYAGAQSIDATGMLVLPGLVNAHTHIGMHLARGLGDDIDLLEAHTKIYYPLGWHPQAVFATEYAYQGSRLACLEAIKAGTTCIIDQNPVADGVARAVEESGIRGVVSPALMDTWLGDKDRLALADRRQLARAGAHFVDQWRGRGDGRVQPWLGPVHEMFCSPELFTDVVRLADKLDVGITVHLAETRAEVEACKAHFGKRSIEYAYDLGLLRPRTVVGHACWLSERDITLLQKSGASVAHTPVCEMKISDGIEPAPRLLEAGVNVALGTDAGAQCNGANDMVREMKVAALLHKVVYPLDPEVIPAEVVLEMATINGARAAGLEREIGSLEPGKKADVIVVDLHKPHLTPVLRKPKFNVVSLLVYSATGGDVDTTIVDGRILMRNRQVLSLDESHVLRDTQAAAEEMVERTTLGGLTYPWRWSCGSTVAGAVAADAH
ncbi:MAG: amidohydrolase family protein [Candidatus Binatia bacterium]